MQYHIILLLVIFYRIACVRWVRARKLSFLFPNCARCPLPVARCTIISSTTSRELHFLWSSSNYLSHFVAHCNRICTVMGSFSVCHLQHFCWFLHFSIRFVTVFFFFFSILISNLSICVYFGCFKSLRAFSKWFAAMQCFPAFCPEFYPNK